MDKSDRNEKPNISRYITVAREYFRAFPLRETPLPGGVRFFFAWLGSMFATAPIDIDIEQVKLASENVEFTEIYDATEKLGLVFLIYAAVNIIFMVFISSIFALVIASSKTRHGPIGLFLFGMMFTAFVASFASGFWSFWKE